MSPQELAALKLQTTRELLETIDENEPTFNEYYVSMEKATKALGGDSTKYEEQDHDVEVVRLRAYSENIKFCGELVEQRVGLRGEQMIRPDDTPVTVILVRDTKVIMDRVKAKMELALVLIKENFTRVAREKAALKASIEEEARSVARQKRAEERTEEVNTAPTQNRQIRFQASEGTRPEMVDVGCTFTQWDMTSYKLKAYYRSAAKPDVFSAQDQQIIFLDFMDSAMQIQVRNKLLIQPDAAWEDCISIVDSIMEIRHPIWNRREKALSITPNEGEK